MSNLSAHPPLPSVRLSSFYLFYFMVLGALVPYFGPYLEHLGFAPESIGALTGILMGTRIVAPLLFGHLVDRSGRRMAWVRGGALVAAVTFAGFFFGESFLWLALVVGVFSFAWSAVLPPMEAITLNHLGSQTARYGRIRLWGSLGFIVGVVTLGELQERFGVGIFLPVCLGLFVAIAVASFTIPDHAGATDDGPQPRLGELLRRPALLSLLVVGMIGQASHGPYYTFFTIHLQHAGYPKSQIGPLWALGVAAEIAVFFVTSRLLSRFSARSLLLTSLGFTSVRWVLTGTLVSSPWALALAQLLHAMSFGVFHAVAIDVIHRTFRGRHQGLGQALYSSVTYGLGSALGSVAAGFAWTRLGSGGTFLAAAALPLVGAVVALLWFHPEPGEPGEP